MIVIPHHIHEGFKAVKDIKGWYPPLKKDPNSTLLQEFDVKKAKWSQQSSQITSFVGILECIKNLTKCSEDLFADLLMETQNLADRIDLLEQSTEWCEQEMDTLVKAQKTGYVFQTNFKKEEKLKYDTEHGLFTPTSIPHGYAQQMEKCADIPQLDLLDNDPLNQPGQLEKIKSFRQNYSDPFGIYLKWLEGQQKKTKRKAQKKKEQLEKRGKSKSIRAAGIQKSVKQVRLKRDKFSFVGQKKKEGRKKRVTQKKKDAMMGGGGGGRSQRQNPTRKLNPQQQMERKMQKQVRREKRMEKRKIEMAMGIAKGIDMDDDLNPEDFDDEDDYYSDDDYSDENEDFDAPMAPDMDGLDETIQLKSSSSRRKVKEQKKANDIFAQIRSGGFNLKKVDKSGLSDKKPKVTERDGMLMQIKRFDKGKLAQAKSRVLKPSKTAKRAPLNVGEILQQQLAFISQVGAEIDDENDDAGDWDDDDDDEW